MLLSRIGNGLMSLLAIAVSTAVWAQTPVPNPSTPPAQKPTPDQLVDDPAKIEGNFVATAGERDGKPLTEDQVKGVTFQFSVDKLSILDRTGKVIHKCTHTIDTTAKPWKINMKTEESAANGKTVVGLIEHTGDTIRIIYPLSGGETPTEFKTREKQEMYELKLQK
ncbi:MAG: TIGR03067 domain-containing protein [Gemmataceae bacterium]